MLLREIYQNMHTLLSKDGNEGLISEDRLNMLWLPTLDELFLEEAKLNKTVLDHGNEKMLSLDIFKLLVAIESVTPNSTGTIDLTSTTAFGKRFKYWGSAKTVNLYNGQIQKVTLVDVQRFNSMYTNVLDAQLDENPIAIMYGGHKDYQYARVYPWDMGDIELTYIQIPNTPFLDYYIDANYKTQYMDAGSSHTLTTGEEYRDGTTSGTKTSQTKELDIPVNFHPRYLNMLMQKIALPIDDQFKVQYSLTKEQQEQ